MTEPQPCAPCKGSGLFQTNEPFQVLPCPRCQGEGKERIIQLAYGGPVVDREGSVRPLWLALTSNGRVLPPDPLDT